MQTIDYATQAQEWERQINALTDEEREQQAEWLEYALNKVKWLHRMAKHKEQEAAGNLDPEVYDTHKKQRHGQSI